jgi:hypothetical protein
MHQLVQAASIKLNQSHLPFTSAHVAKECVSKQIQSYVRITQQITHSSRMVETLWNTSTGTVVICWFSKFLHRKMHVYCSESPSGVVALLHRFSL